MVLWVFLRRLQARVREAKSPHEGVRISRVKKISLIVRLIIFVQLSGINSLTNYLANSVTII